jgi:glycosyltransferase involved in cell wall biosynthesis
MTARLTWLLLATHVPPSGTGGGMVRYVVEFAQALRSRDDVALTVLARPGTVPFFSDLLAGSGQVAVAPPLPTPGLSLLEREGLGVRALRQPFDVIHGTKHLIPRRGDGQRVLTVHDMLPLDRPGDFGTLKRALLVRPYLASLRQASVLCCVSNATRERLSAYLPESRAKAVVIPLAMSSHLAAAAAVPVAALVGRRFALVVGDPSPRKNLGLLVDIWPEVTRAFPDAVLAVVGPESWGPTDRGDHFASMAAQGSVLPLGHLDDGQLRWCYEHAAVVACPSHAEGFGLPALEALTFGAPLITSLDSALCEASGSTATHLPSTEPDQWVQPIVERLGHDRRPSPARVDRTWDDVAAETVSAVRRRRGWSSQLGAGS